MGPPSGVPFSGGNQRVRDQVLVILSEEFPLTTKELYNRIAKQGHEVTYQAVHKVLAQLMNEGVVEKKDRALQLSRNWIHRVKSYVLATENLYAGKKDIRRLIQRVDKEPVSIPFTDLSEMETTAGAILAERMLPKGKWESYYIIMDHALWPLKFNFEDFLLLQKVNQNNPNSCALIISDSPFDRWIVSQYWVSAKGTGGRAVIDPKAGRLKEDVIAYGEYIVRIRFSTETKKWMNKIYQRIHGLYNLLAFYYTNQIDTAKVKVDLIIEKNPAYAQLVREKVERSIITHNIKAEK